MRINPFAHAKARTTKGDADRSAFALKRDNKLKTLFPPILSESLVDHDETAYQPARAISPASSKTQIARGRYSTLLGVSDSSRLRTIADRSLGGVAP